MLIIVIIKIIRFTIELSNIVFNQLIFCGFKIKFWSMICEVYFREYGAEYHSLSFYWLL